MAQTIRRKATGVRRQARAHDTKRQVRQAKQKTSSLMDWLMRKLPFTHIFGGKSHDPAIELAEKLKEMAPVPISKVFFTCSGSEANDTQMKLVWYMNNALGRPNKKKVFARLKA